MRIAIVQPRTSYHVGGSEKVSLKHAEHLAKQGYTVDLYTTSPKSLDDSFLFRDFLQLNTSGVNVMRFDITNSIPDLYSIQPDTDHVRWITESLAFNVAIFKFLEQSKPDIILSYYLPDSIFKPLDIPNVIYLSGYPSQPITWYQSFIRFCHATISISSSVSEKWLEYTRNTKLTYELGTGVDSPIIAKNTIRGNAKYNLVFAGRLIERKGILVLLDSFADIIKMNTDAHLWILGNGELFHSIQAKIKTLGLEEKVSLLGTVENPYDYFLLADLCVFPSLYGDGLMGTVLESMSAGKPVITTTDNGNEDVIEHGVNGYLIEPNNKLALTNSILELLANEAKRKSMGAEAQRFIENNSSWQANCKKLAAILEEVVIKTSNSY